jgi:hypothetical protein
MGMGYVANKLRATRLGKSSRRDDRGGFAAADRVPLANENGLYPNPAGSIDRLQRSEWHLGVSSITDSSGRTTWQVNGRLGEHRFQVEGATRAEAWHRAVEAAAAVGMLAD